MKKIILTGILACMLCLGLIGCAEEKPAATLPPVHIVTFEAAGQVWDVQYVEDGCLPEPLGEENGGPEFRGWQDENGEPVDPFATAVHADTTYYAQVKLVVTSHARFLFLDSDKRLRPDEPLTGQELRQALAALAPQYAQYLPDMPEGDTPVDGDALWQVLSAFYPDNAPVFSGSEPVTRAQFASEMVVLLGRDQENVDISPECVLPVDVFADREDVAALYEASVSHRISAGSGGWEQAKVPLPYEPGFVNIGGYLYYVDQDRQFVKNTSVGTLEFDAEGRYTSGNKELDWYVLEILRSIRMADPEASSLTLLRQAYAYCRDELSNSATSEVPDREDENWQLRMALEAFRTGSGSSFHHAAAFSALARGLGYEAVAVSGIMEKANRQRGWVVISMDGADYIFDSHWEWDQRTNSNNSETDMFMISRRDSLQWGYEWEQ